MGPRNALVAAALGVTGLAPAALPVAPAGVTVDIPPRMLAAYVDAAESPAACPGIRWPIVAAVYARESDHGRFGGSTVGADGVIWPPIYGVPVPSAGGARAEGPGQFMPESWRLFGEGDPQDVDDAAVATVRHLCGTHGDLLGDHLRSAIVSYYGADRDGYADDVLARTAAFDAAAPTIAAISTGGGLVEEGLTLRITDRLIGRTLVGWDRLAGWLVGRNPDTAPTVGAIDRAVDGLTAPAGARPSTSVAVSTAGGVLCPVSGGEITSDYGDARDGGARQHMGIDLAAVEGTPVVAPFPARVVETIDVEADGGLGGISLWLEAASGPHKGAQVYIAHNRRNTVRAGQLVAQGEQVAELGNTGVGTGPHAHISWAPDGGAFADPTPIRNACQEARP